MRGAMALPANRLFVVTGNGSMRQQYDIKSYELMTVFARASRSKLAYDKGRRRPSEAQRGCRGWVRWRDGS